jgi:tousled-like kinase
MFDQKMKEVQ